MRDQPSTRGSGGRVPGSRGQATRLRLLSVTKGLLEVGGFRGLRVVDIAREAGTSPATFYQYFSDIEAALLALVGDVEADADQRLRKLIDTEPWSDNPRLAAKRLAEAFLTFWADHRAVINVVDLRDAEGEGPLMGARSQLLSGTSSALETVIDAAWKERGSLPRTVGDARALAFVLVAMLANVASHQRGMVNAGVSPQQLSAAMAQQVLLAVLGSPTPQG